MVGVWKSACAEGICAVLSGSHECVGNPLALSCTIMAAKPPKEPSVPGAPGDGVGPPRDGGAARQPCLLDASGGGHFSTTHWSVVMAAAHGSEVTARRALEALCEKYWPPIYAFMRRQGLGAEDAQDATQGLFASLIESESLRKASPERGRFRSYLLGAAKHYLSNERKSARAKKRGGGQWTLSLDFEREEAQYRAEPADPDTPDKMYERRWVLALLDSTLERLAEEARQQGEEAVFAALRPYLTREEPAAPYAAAAAALGTTEGAFKVAVHRLRKRFAAMLRAEIADTLCNPDEVDEEIQHLFSLFS